MDKQFRKEQAALANQKAINSTSLLDLEREMSMYEIAIISRAAPAKLLGLDNKGHLGVSPVTITRLPHIPKASAKVSIISVDLISISMNKFMCLKLQSSLT